MVTITRRSLAAASSPRLDPMTAPEVAATDDSRRSAAAATAANIFASRAMHTDT